MQLETLWYMLDIAQTHSINQSAKKYFVSQQMMSKAIKGLEIELGVILLNRTKRGVTLTEAGEALVRRAKEMQTSYGLLCEELQPFQEGKVKAAGPITVYITPKLASLFSDMLLVQIPHMLPETALSICTLESEHIVKESYFDEASLGMITSSMENLRSDSFQALLKARRLKAVVLAEYPLFACMHKNAPWAAQEKFNLKDLERVPMTFFEPNEFLVLAENAPIELEARYAVKSVEMEEKIVREKLGAAILPLLEYDLLFGQSNKYVLRPLEGVPNICYLYLVKADCTLAPQLVKLLDLLRRKIC